jgi:hypothetical protein
MLSQECNRAGRSDGQPDRLGHSLGRADALNRQCGANPIGNGYGNDLGRAHKRDSLSFGVRGRVRRQIVHGETKEVLSDSGFQPNLLLDKFFSELASNDISSLLASGFIEGGTGNSSPVRKDSTPTTLSQSGTTVTASSAFFSSGDVGNLLVYGSSGSGTNICYITAFTNSTTVTVSVSQTVASVVGTVWYVSSAWALSGTTLLVNTKSTNSGQWGTAYSGGVYTYTCTFNSAVQTSSITLLQLAYGVSGFLPFASFTIPGAGDTIPVDYFYVVTWEFEMTVTPSTPSAQGNVGTGINTAGNIMIESLGGFSTLNSSGTAAGPQCPLDGNGGTGSLTSSSGFLTSDTYTQNSSVAAAGSEPVLSNTNGYFTTSQPTLAWSAPSDTGTTVGTFTASFNTTGNGAVITGLGIIKSSSSRNVYLDVQLTSTYTSPSSGSFTFVFVFTVTVGRTVVN